MLVPAVVGRRDEVFFHVIRLMGLQARPQDPEPRALVIPG
jgi:hypothetical protein